MILTFLTSKNQKNTLFLRKK